MKQFNVRVYGVAHWKNCVLITDEIRSGKRMTKFVGGGLEFGEGIRDALHREFKEETGLEIEVLNHLYTTDFFQTSAFNTDHQLISIYYHVQLLQPELVKVVSQPFEGLNTEGQCFRWVNADSLKASDFTFPIDQFVVQNFRAEMIR